MKVNVRYAAQARHAAGCSSETIELASPCSISELLLKIAKQKEGLRNLLLDSNGNANGALLVFVNEEQISSRSPQQINDGDDVEILSPISGG